MSFNGLPGFFIAGNSGPTQIAYWFGNQEDQGAQWAMAHPELNEGFVPLSGLFALGVSNFVKCAWFDWDAGEFRYTYNVSISNEEPRAVYFTLQGGGNV